MTPTVAIVASGAMGTAIARLLVANGVRVITSFEGRSAASIARAQSAGMRDVPFARLAEADFVLSIVPPIAALQFAESMRDPLSNADPKPVFVDCNAVSPGTVQEVAGTVTATGTRFVDASIIGIAPKPGEPSPHIYASGEHAATLHRLVDHGLDIRVLEGAIGAASALKMAFAGISKGTLAVATAMILAATRAGAAEALHRELAESESVLLERLARRIPGMFPKAYRWVAEMQEIAEFAGDDRSAADIFDSFSSLYERIASDAAGENRETAALLQFFTKPEHPASS
jgi:L-threonate 2-dehydrogenase